jgi:hypothetical protein
MSDDTQSRRERAGRLRKQIEEAKNPPKDPSDNPEEIKPGESPKEYVDRRSRPTLPKKPTKT